MGLTTLICFFLSLLFRINVAAIQVFNYAVCPLQVILYFPFLKMATILVPNYHLYLSFPGLMEQLKTDFFNTFLYFWDLNLVAIMIWFIMSMPIGLILYFASKRIFSRMKWMSREANVPC